MHPLVTLALTLPFSPRKKKKIPTIDKRPLNVFSSDRRGGLLSGAGGGSGVVRIIYGSPHTDPRTLLLPG